MSNHGLQTYNDGYAKPTGSMRPNQSMWMDRWMTTNSDRTLQVHNKFSLRDESRGKDPDLQHGVRVVHIAKPSNYKMLDINAAPCNISEYRNSWRCQREDIAVASEVPQSAKAVEVVTETKRAEITCETLVTNSKSSKLEIQPISMFDFSKKTGSVLAQKRMAVSFEDELNTQTDDISKHASTLEPSNSNCLIKALKSAPSETTFQLKEYHSWPESRLKRLGQLAKPYISLDKNRMHNGEPGNRMHNFTPNGLPPSHSCPGQVRRLEELNKGCHSSSDVPRPVLGSVEAVSSSPKFSQTTNHLSIADVSKGNQIPRATTISTKFKESASHRLFTLLPDFDCHGESSEKLHPPGSSRNSEGKKDERTAFLASKNESSAETDTMDINVCQTWNSLPSITSSPSYKDTKGGEKPAISHSTTLGDNFGSGKTKIELLDINRDPPASLAAAQEIGEMNLSNSRTESLDGEHLHHADQAGNSNSSSQQCLALSADPSSRWIKRLRLCSSDYRAHGTKNVKIGDSSFTAKVDELCNKKKDYNRTSSRPTFSEHFGEEVGKMELDETLLPLGNKEPASKDSMKECWGLNLSHPWIQRWCHNQAPCPQMNSGVPVACELDCSKTALDEDQTKQCPSIAAMALMGKTMKGLQSCKFHNKGSFVVWGTGGL